MSIKDFCRTDVVTIDSKTTVREAAELMKQKHIGYLIVQDEKKHTPIGVLTDRDIVRFVVANGMNAENIYAEDIMSRNPSVVLDKSGIYEVIDKMRKYGYRRMPVVDEQRKLIGVVALDDMVDLLAKEMLAIADISRTQQAKEESYTLV